MLPDVHHSLAQQNLVTLFAGSVSACVWIWYKVDYLQEIHRYCNHQHMCCCQKPDFCSSIENSKTLQNPLKPGITVSHVDKNLNCVLLTETIVRTQVLMKMLGTILTDKFLNCREWAIGHPLDYHFHPHWVSWPLFHIQLSVTLMVHDCVTHMLGINWKTNFIW